MSNQTTQDAIRSHSLTRFLNDEKLANLNAKGREFVSLSLELADTQMRADCNNREAKLKSIDMELEKLTKERDDLSWVQQEPLRKIEYPDFVSSSRILADSIELERVRLRSQQVRIRKSITQAKEKGYYKDHSDLRDAVDTGKPIPEGTELPFFLNEAITFVEIHGSPENNRNGANSGRWTNPTLWYLLIRDLLQFLASK